MLVVIAKGSGVSSSAFFADVVGRRTAPAAPEELEVGVRGGDDVSECFGIEAAEPTSVPSSVASSDSVLLESSGALSLGEGGGEGDDGVLSVDEGAEDDVAESII